jgi:phage tail-like protein
MPLANNGTGSGVGDNYSPTNPAMITNMLAPVDGDVYVYGYDDDKQQIIVRKIAKQAQVPHKGVSPHPVYSTNLVRDSFSQTDASGNTTTFSSLLQPSMQRLQGLQDNPVLNSHTHALHGRAGTSARESFEGQDNLLQPTTARLRGLAENSVLNSKTHALHGRAGTAVREAFGGQDNLLQFTAARLRGLAENPVANSRTHALHGRAGSSIRQDATYTFSKDGSQSFTIKNALPHTVARINALNDNPVTGSHTHALHGKASNQLPAYNAAKEAIANSGVKTGALHGRAGSGPVDGLVQGLGAKLMDMMQGDKTWPLAKFYFYVSIGPAVMGFQNVEGLETEVGVIEYRDGNSPMMSKERMPGLVTYSRVTMKKGVFANDTDGSRWLREITVNRQYAKRRLIFIALLDHNHMPQFIWRYERTFITKYTPTALDAESENEVAIEEMEFVGQSWYADSLLGMAADVAGAAAGAIGNLF